LKQSWCFPKATAEFVWRMEDVLDVYCRPYDPRRPLLCMDEMGKNLVADKRPPEAMKPGQIKREDDTYEKKGSGNVFLACEPNAGPALPESDQAADQERLGLLPPRTAHRAICAG
jgi:hypothetical protein